MLGIKFPKNSILNKQQIDKIGNTIIFLADMIPSLYLTKLLKLIYILDEISIKERGIPFLGLNYKVWQAGPVNQDLYIDINDGVIIFREYFTANQNNNAIQITSVKDFNDDEFSDAELELLDRLVKLFKYTSDQDLVTLTHRPSSLWYRKAQETGLLELFKQGMTNSSEVEINLEDLLIGQDEKKEIFKEYIEFQKVKEALSRAN